MEIKPQISITNFMLPLQSGKELFNDGTKSIYTYCQFTVATILGLIAVWLSFGCNDLGPSSPISAIILQIIYSVFAFLFGGLYILYYLIVHWLGDDVLMSAGFTSSCPSRQK